MDRESFRIYQEKWEKKNKKYRKEYHRKWYIRNKKRLNKQAIIWAKENPERTKEIYKKWRDKNSEYFQRWYVKNIDTVKKQHKEYSKTEEGKASNQRRHIKRRAKEREIINTLTSQEWLDILKDYDYKCAYCGIEFDENTLPEKDHIIPIDRGGDNIKENIMPSCRSCNAKKGTKILKQ